jgi:hypothetical protein
LSLFRALRGGHPANEVDEWVERVFERDPHRHPGDLGRHHRIRPRIVGSPALRHGQTRGERGEQGASGHEREPSAAEHAIRHRAHDPRRGRGRYAHRDEPLPLSNGPSGAA